MVSVKEDSKLMPMEDTTEFTVAKMVDGWNTSARNEGA